MRWPLDDFFISQDYSSGHPALDLAAPAGIPIKAPEAGLVSEVNNDANAYFGGKYVIINGDSGHRHYFGHNSSNFVGAGQRVSEGQHIANIGATGFAIPDKGISAPTGPHTHHEVTQTGTGTPVKFKNLVKAKEDEMYKGKTAEQLGKELDIVHSIAKDREGYLDRVGQAAGHDPKHSMETPDIDIIVGLIDGKNKRVVDLEAEVARLKQGSAGQSDDKLREAIKAFKKALEEL